MRLYVLPLNYGPYLEFLFALPCIYMLRYTTEYVMNIVQISGDNKGTMLIEVFTGYNSSIKLVFYSVIIFIITFTIEYICNKKSNLIHEKMGRSSKYLF